MLISMNDDSLGMRTLCSFFCLLLHGAISFRMSVSGILALLQFTQDQWHQILVHSEFTRLKMCSKIMQQISYYRATEALGHYHV